MKLTKLYPPSIKPVRSGVYKVSTTYIEPGFAFFNTRTGKWGSIYSTASAANRLRSPSGAIQEKYWRGLAKEPK